jgi:hypothetical protein
MGSGGGCMSGIIRVLVIDMPVGIVDFHGDRAEHVFTMGMMERKCLPHFVCSCDLNMSKQVG